MENDKKIISLKNYLKKHIQKRHKGKQTATSEQETVTISKGSLQDSKVVNIQSYLKDKNSKKEVLSGVTQNTAQNTAQNITQNENLNIVTLKDSPVDKTTPQNSQLRNQSEAKVISLLDYKRKNQQTNQASKLKEQNSQLRNQSEAKVISLLDYRKKKNQLETQKTPNRQMPIYQSISLVASCLLGVFYLSIFFGSGGDSTQYRKLASESKSLTLTSVMHKITLGHFINKNEGREVDRNIDSTKEKGLSASAYINLLEREQLVRKINK